MCDAWAIVNLEVWNKIISFVDHLFENMASNGPPCGFSQQIGKVGVGKRRTGDGLSEARWPLSLRCEQCSQQLAWCSLNRIAPWTERLLCPETHHLSLLPVRRARLVTSSPKRKMSTKKCCQYTREKRWILQRLTVRHLSLLFDPTPTKAWWRRLFARALEKLITKGVWVLLQTGQKRCGRHRYSETSACTVK